MLSPTYDFQIFLQKISPKTSAEVLAAAEEEIHGLEFTDPQQRSASLAYLRDLRLLTNYIYVPPYSNDRRGPVPEHIRQTLHDLRLLSG
jgi:hypothetical protein